MGLHCLPYLQTVIRLICVKVHISGTLIHFLPSIIDNIISIIMYIKHADKHVLLSLLIHCSINESTVCGNHTRLYDIIKVIFMHVIYFGTRKVNTIVPHPVLTRRLSPH